MPLAAVIRRHSVQVAVLYSLYYLYIFLVRSRPFCKEIMLKWIEAKSFFVRHDIQSATKKIHFEDKQKHRFRHLLKRTRCASSVWLTERRPAIVSDSHEDCFSNANRMVNQVLAEKQGQSDHCRRVHVSFLFGKVRHVSREPRRSITVATATSISVIHTNDE